MQIIIDIDKEYYKAITEIPNHQCTADMLIIKNGTPLPKGHGRLIDADRLKSMYSINRGNFNTVVGIQKWIDDAETIIEADKEEDKNANNN